MSKLNDRWYSSHLERDVSVARWGEVGRPVLVFPTAGGDAEEIERFHIVDACADLIGAGKVKLYSCDSANGRALFVKEGDSRHRSWILRQFVSFIGEELVPAIHADCGGAMEIITAGASIGAYNALASLCRYPERFSAAICMSGTYDLERFMDGPVTDDFRWASPIHHLGSLRADQLDQVRARFVVLACGGGANEDVGESWNAAHQLGSHGIPNRVDEWGPEWPHDWHTWRAMLPTYLSELVDPRD